MFFSDFVVICWKGGRRDEGDGACGAFGPLDVGAYPAALPPAGPIPSIRPTPHPSSPFSLSGHYEL